jgi:competence protein ComEC
MIIVLISFLFGIYWGLYFKNIALFFCFLILIGLIIKILNVKRVFLIVALISSLGFLYINVKENQFNNLPSEVDIQENFRIVSLTEEGEYKNLYIAKSEVDGRKVKLYISKKMDELSLGSIYQVTGTFTKADEARNEGCFNYRNYLKQKNICGIVNATNINFVESRKSLITIGLKLQDKASKIIKNSYTNNVSEFLQGIILGNTSEISDDLKQNFRDSNLSHILAISGMHISYIVILIKFLLKKLKINKKLESFITILILFFFLIITNFPVSAIRACIMQSLILLAFIIDRKQNFINSFCISMLIILILNPYNIYNVGMWLSFGGTFGIVAFQRFIRILLNMISGKFYNKILKNFVKFIKINRKNLNEKYDKKLILKNTNLTKSDIKIKSKLLIINNLNFIKYNFKKYLLENIAISISVQIIIFPIILHSFYSFSLTFFISNILISPIIGPIIILGIISIIIGVIEKSIFLTMQKIKIIKIILLLPNLLIKFVLKIICFSETVLVKLLFWVAEFCSKIPLSKIYTKPVSLIFILIYYLVILLIIVKLQKNIIRRVLHLWRIVCGKVKINKLLYKLIVVICIIVFWANNVFYFTNSAIGNLKIYFLDVSQGDSTAIVTPKGKTILIDGGEGGESSSYDYGEKVLFPFLISKGIKKIDFLISTHADLDHIRRAFLYFGKHESK